jgi:pyridoxine 4-dehydrogenase
LARSYLEREKQTCGDVDEQRRLPPRHTGERPWVDLVEPLSVVVICLVGTAKTGDPPFFKSIKRRLKMSQTTLAQLPMGQIGFGAMRITGPGIWGPPRSEGEAIALLRRAVEKGVIFIDTADSYGPGVSETLIAKALCPYPAGLVVATKGGLLRPGADRWVTDCRPEHLRRACEDSLKRLRLRCIELYQLHAVDYRIPVEDSIGALVDLQREGKIRHIGMSNVSERELARARAVAPIVSVQNRYNLRDRSSDRLIDICAEAGIAFIPWYPLAAGRLASPDSALARIAQRRSATASQISLAWLLQRSPAMLPIPGTSSIAHLEENLASASIRLTSDEFRTLASL